MSFFYIIVKFVIFYHTSKISLCVYLVTPIIICLVITPSSSHFLNDGKKARKDVKKQSGIIENLQAKNLKLEEKVNQMKTSLDGDIKTQISRLEKKVDQITDLQKTISGLEEEVKTLKSHMETWLSATLQSVSLILSTNNNLCLRYK